MVHSLPHTLAALILSVLGGSCAAGSGAGLPQATKYTDNNSNITFLGYAIQGFQFGMALPSTPQNDLIIQLVSPLKNRAGWGGVDFGERMTHHLLLVAWPNTDRDNTVMISPRIATGYEVSSGANLYTANPIAITQIPTGTFVNDTHVSATFVCGRCLNSDSFGSEIETATLSYAFAYEAVVDPGNIHTKLSDHTANGEPYGPFNVTIAQAESSEYQIWAALTNPPASPTGVMASPTNSATSATAPAAHPGATATSSRDSPSPASSPPGAGTYIGTPTFSFAVVFALLGVACIYVLQALQIL